MRQTTNKIGKSIISERESDRRIGEAEGKGFSYTAWNSQSNMWPGSTFLSSQSYYLRRHLKWWALKPFNALFSSIWKDNIKWHATPDLHEQEIKVCGYN